MIPLYCSFGFYLLISLVLVLAFGAAFLYMRINKAKNKLYETFSTVSLALALLSLSLVFTGPFLLSIILPSAVGTC